jgi:hypothetical protein
MPPNRPIKKIKARRTYSKPSKIEGTSACVPDSTPPWFSWSRLPSAFLEESQAEREVHAFRTTNFDGVIAEGPILVDFFLLQMMDDMMVSPR